MATIWDMNGIAGKFMPLPRDGAGVIIPPLGERQSLPPPRLRHFYGYKNGFPDDALYESGGRSDAHKLFETLHEVAPTFAPKHCLDFGCSAGRVIRHFPLFTPAKLWGVDIHAEAILWASQNLHGPFRFATTTTTPHLPFKDSYFDLVFAGSVFTHMDELYTAWLLELARVTHPTGYLALSFSSEHTQKLLQRRLPDHPSHKAISSLKPRKEKSHFLTGSSPWTMRRLQSRSLFLQELADLFDIMLVRENGYGWQCLVILKPR